MPGGCRRTWARRASVAAAATALVARVHGFALAGPDHPAWVFFASADGGPSSFAAAGFKRGLGGHLYESGLLVMGSVGTGAYQYRAGVLAPRIVTGRTLAASLLVGAQWVVGGTTLAAFMGPELEHHALTPPDRHNRSSGTHAGLRLHGEVWSHPTPDWLLTATVIGGTAAPHLWGRIAAGYRLWRGVFVGPEALAYANPTYRDLRLGLHATGFALGRFSLRLSGGLLLTRSEGPGAYVGLTAHTSY